MTMLNQAHVEAICSATYLENYLDCLDSLPDELQRILTQIREIDVKIHELELDSLPFEEMLAKISSGGENVDQKTVSQMSRMLIRMQECEDEKIQLSASLMDFIEARSKQLESDRENLDPSNHMIDHSANSRGSNSTSNKRNNTASDTKGSTSNSNTHSDAHKDTKQTESRVATSSAKKRKQKSVDSSTLAANRTSGNLSKAAQQSSITQSGSATSNRDKEDNSNRKSQASSVVDPNSKLAASKLPIKRKRRSRIGSQARSVREKEPSLEPEEPTYCLCNQISYGEMIGCDNDACSIEWFHFNCVNLVNKPKGRWYCPKCRGDKASVMKKADKR